VQVFDPFTFTLKETSIACGTETIPICFEEGVPVPTTPATADFVPVQLTTSNIGTPIGT